MYFSSQTVHAFALEFRCDRNHSILGIVSRQLCLVFTGRRAAAGNRQKYADKTWQQITKNHFILIFVQIFKGFQGLFENEQLYHFKQLNIISQC